MSTWTISGDILIPRCFTSTREINITKRVVSAHWNHIGIADKFRLLCLTESQLPAEVTWPCCSVKWSIAHCSPFVVFQILCPTTSIWDAIRKSEVFWNTLNLLAFLGFVGIRCTWNTNHYSYKQRWYLWMIIGAYGTLYWNFNIKWQQLREFTVTHRIK